MRSIISTGVLLVATVAPAAGAEEQPRGSESDRPGREWRLSIAAGSHNVSWPLQFLRPAHPAVVASLETPLTRTRFFEVPLRVSVLGFSDRDFSLSGAQFALETGQRFRLFKSIYPEASVILGYMASRDTRQGFRQADARWTSVRGDMRSSLVFGAGVSVELSPRGRSWPSGIVLAYRWLAETPYVASEEPLMAHGVWSIGAKFRIRSGGRQGR